MSELWSPEEDATLQAFWGTEMTRRMISKELGRSSSAIRARATRLKLPDRSWVFNVTHRGLRPKIEAMLTAGKTTSKIMALTGASKRYIEHVAQEHRHAEKPPFQDHRDGDYWTLALAHGGFPAIGFLNGKPVWKWPRRAA